MARSLSRETVGGSESPNSGMPLADAFRYRGAAGLEHEDLAGDVGIDVGLGQKGADLAARDALDHFREGGLHCALEGQPHLDDGPGFSMGQPQKRASGLGLIIALAKQLGGTLNVTTDRGARCVVRFGGSPSGR